MSVRERLWNIFRAEMGGRGSAAVSNHAEPQQNLGGEIPSTPSAQVDPVIAGFYANLELPYGADLAAVEASWKRLMRKYHPDRHGDEAQRSELATELSKKLNYAYAQLRQHLASEKA